MQLTPWSLWSLFERVTGLSSGLLGPHAWPPPSSAPGPGLGRGTDRRCACVGPRPAPSLRGRVDAFVSHQLFKAVSAAGSTLARGDFPPSTLHPPPEVMKQLGKDEAAPPPPASSRTC